MKKTLVLLGGLCLAAMGLRPAIVAAQEPPLIAPTDALSPEEQQKLFRLPDGFEIQLVVSEPEIGQPMNLQFDAAGRLWVTSSVEYPYPAEGPGVEPREERFAGREEPHPPRDWVTVLSGIGADGKAARAVRFAEGLNIPIGVLPLAEGALIYSIPSIDHWRDTNGDSVADAREVLVTGFGNVDTHGMVNGLRRGLDGWIYACHGFRNDSKVRGADGSQIKMNSGNTFRFRPEGTQVEQFTWGQVNPFGLTFDPLGNLYSADCHSMPLTLLLRGAYYPSFGKPHDGLGFGPRMIDHSHGSTGICGPAYYAATHFPPDYRDNLYLCNPVTGRVHRDKLVWTGSSPMVETQPDFVTCDDPWFRPVDLAVGPEGALYIADFYNAIIGHYEVPLGHPKRDRSKGRVWRIVYRGESEARDADDQGSVPPDLTSLNARQLVARLGDENLTVRMLATQELIDRHADEAAQLVTALLAGEGAADQANAAPEVQSGGPKNELQRAHALWVAERLGRLEGALLEALADDESRLVRTHVARLIGERDEWSERERAILLRFLTEDRDAFVRRAAADALGARPDPEFVRPLLDTLHSADAGDTHLIHTLRLALRNVFRHASDSPLDEASPFVALDKYSPEDLRTLAGVLGAVRTRAAAGLLYGILLLDLTTTADLVSEAAWPAAWAHVVRYQDLMAVRDMAAALRTLLQEDLEQQLRLLDAAREALQQRGSDPREVLGDWGQELATRLLKASGTALSWTEESSGDLPTWVLQERRCVDGEMATFWSSLPNGEQRTGVLRSQPFVLPARLSFSVAGHAGFPNQQPHDRNAVRLRDAETGAVLREAAPPRHDVAHPISWDLENLAGRRGYLELQDGDSANAYAWLAVGRFSLDRLNPSGAARSQHAAELIAALRLETLSPMLQTLLADSSAGDGVRSAAASALVSLTPEPRLAALVPLLGDPAVPRPVQEQIAAATLSRAPEEITQALTSAIQSLPATAQQPLAERLASTPAGAEMLLALVEQGQASPRLLVRPTIKERLSAHAGSGFLQRLEALTADLPPEDDAIRQLIEVRTRAFTAGAASAERGAALYAKHCANCHRIGSEGAVVGPQLDGIGVRGLARLAEDVLDPNRNVDGAFKSSTLVLQDGRVLTGLIRREEGESLVLADTKGEEFRVPKAEIAEQATSPLSLMPGNFGELLSEAEFQDLMAYLLEQRQ